MTPKIGESAWHANEARGVLDQIGKQQREDGMTINLAEALAVAQVHATLSVAEAIRERACS